MFGFLKRDTYTVKVYRRVHVGGKDKLLATANLKTYVYSLAMKRAKAFFIKSCRPNMYYIVYKMPR